ncbi:MAG: type III pantothenate kinase [Sinobacteraceae bacterium]|nr:type III pantothenate kinase [Nevskiaceae bacterium]MCP5467552.1 type III pantothenate kinase [Nevskiaceae bacterium]
MTARQVTMRLLIDVGNTRLKWARLHGSRLGPMHAAVHAGWSSDDYRRALAPALRDVEAVEVVSVAGARVDRALTRASRVLCRAAPRFVSSTRRAAGVSNGYREVWRLGADRWVAAIGGWHLPARRGRSVCVVDIGTATTIDLVDEQGRHRGGTIVPGPALMVSSLLQGTRGIKRRAVGAAATNVPPVPFARSTRAALEAGAYHAVAALIDRAVDAARQLTGRRPLLLLTGGAAPAIARHVRRPHVVVPDLVLRGLVALVDASPLPPHRMRASHRGGKP